MAKRKAVWHICGTEVCRAGAPVAVLTGLSDEMCAWVARVEPMPLSPAGEYLALMDGRWTYHLDRGELWMRDRWRISHRPASSTTAVVCDHRCGEPIPAEWGLIGPPPKPRPSQEVFDVPLF